MTWNEGFRWSSSMTPTDIFWMVLEINAGINKRKNRLLYLKNLWYLFDIFSHPSQLKCYRCVIFWSHFMKWWYKCKGSFRLAAGVCRFLSGGYMSADRYEFFYLCIDTVHCRKRRLLDLVCTGLQFAAPNWICIYQNNFVRNRKFSKFSSGKVLVQIND